MKPFRGILGLTLQGAFTIAAVSQTVNNLAQLKPPVGSAVAVIEFEDLECPFCAHLNEVVHKAVDEQHVPLVVYDFPLKIHPWAFAAAVYARFFTESVSYQVGDEFRTAVFTSQTLISSREDLQAFAQRFADSKGIHIPIPIDPGNKIGQEVEKDIALGKRLNVIQTPTIVIVTRDGYKTVMGDPSDTSINPETLPALLAKIVSLRSVR